MARKRSRAEPESVTLYRHSEHAQNVIRYLDMMRDHQPKCARCRNIPGVRAEARPCATMTEFAIFAAIAWERVPRSPQFEQPDLFGDPADPWKVR